MPFKKGSVPWNKSDTNSICFHCGKIFHISPSRLIEKERKMYGRGKYCTRKCKDEAQINKKTWNTELTGYEYKKHYPKGFKNTFKKGQYADRKNKNWKETGFSYIALHQWVRRKLGKANVCSNCRSEKNIQWANKSGEYKRDLSDWISLCAVCHRRYDNLTGDWRTRPHRIKDRFYERNTTSK